MAATVLVTGGTGLIGQQVLSQWDLADLTPVAVDRSQLDLLAPGAGAELVRDLRPDVVLHLAWAGCGLNGYRSSAENDLWVDRTIEVFDACRGTGAHFIATGTAVDGSFDPPDSYSKAKVRLRRNLQDSIDNEDLTWLRPYYVMDIARRRPAMVHDGLAALEAGTPVQLRTPLSEHDFVHSNDVATAILSVIRHRIRGEVPVGSGRLRRVCDLMTALGVSWIPTHQSIHGSLQHHHDAADITTLTSNGWSPRSTAAFFNAKRVL